LNFKIIILFSLFGFIGCGVKSDPKKYPEISVPSYLEKYEEEEHTNKPKP
jgi:hypothetical protein